MALTKKRRKFINEYLKCWNGTEAARRSGYSHPNSQAHRLLNVEEIKEAIDNRLAEVQMQADEILLIFSRIARGENVAGDKPSISEMLRAAENMAKIRDMYTERIEHVGEQRHTIEVKYDDRFAATSPPGANGGYRERRDEERLGVRKTVG